MKFTLQAQRSFSSLHPQGHWPSWAALSFSHSQASVSVPLRRLHWVSIGFTADTLQLPITQRDKWKKKKKSAQKSVILERGTDEAEPADAGPVATSPPAKPRSTGRRPPTSPVDSPLDASQWPRPGLPVYPPFSQTSRLRAGRSLLGQTQGKDSTSLKPDPAQQSSEHLGPAWRRLL